MCYNDTKEVIRMEDICNVIPPKENPASLEFYYFVYETNFRKLPQPFVHSNFYVYLTFKGTATLKTENKEYTLTPGTLLFTFPYQKIEIASEEEFTYLYIAFNGAGADELLNNLSINKENFVFPNFEHLTNFWMSSIRRISPSNGNTLAESVLLYTLSYINTIEEHSRKNGDRFESILEYVDNNFTDPNLSVGKVADLFFYSKKYFSSLFFKRQNVKFTDYLNGLRIQYAVSLLREHSASVSEIATKCGFSDPFYFSKVFKKFTGKTPTEFMKNLLISPSNFIR